MKKLFILLISISIIHNLGMSQGCLPNGISFTAQSQIDDFETNYPNCSEIEGYVRIYGNDITNLSGLSCLTSIEGVLSIGWASYGNPNLSSLNGLHNLNSIGGLYLFKNHLLTDLNGLNSLTYITGGIYSNFNSKLDNIDALSNVTHIGGSIIFYDNESLSSLDGLYNLTSINGDFIISDDYYLAENYSLSSLSGLDNISSISGDLILRRNHQLANLHGLDSLIIIGGDLVLDANSTLNNLESLNMLSSIGGNFWMFNIPVTSLEPLSSLQEIDGSISFLGVWYLTSLEGLNNINPNSLDGLGLRRNFSLSDCSIQSICEYLKDSTSNTTIEINDVGCNSIEEVEEGCELVHISRYEVQKGANFYPNPASTYLTITDIEPGLIELNIYSIKGEKRLTTNSFTEYIDISSLESGIYSIEFISQKESLRSKLIIK